MRQSSPPLAPSASAADNSDSGVCRCFVAVFIKNNCHAKIANGDGAGRKHRKRILCGDSLRLLAQLPEESADMIFADPPYNLQLTKKLYRPNGTEVAGVCEDWDKFSSFAEYDDFCRSWLVQCRRLLKPTGSIWVIGTYHNIYRIGRLMQDIGFWMLNDVIWHKTNPMPNFRGVRFTNATETLLWAKKSEKARYVFNHQTMKNENGGKQMTNVWSIPVCGGAERLRDADGKKLHSTQKPQELLRRVMLSSTKPGDVVLDPFLGSGTTLAVARNIGRRGVGLERESQYVEIAKRRVAAMPVGLINTPAEREPLPRVLFEEIVKKGMVSAGQKLYAKGGEVAVVQNDGKIKLNGHAGSIHRIGAMIADAPTCNGWNFWSFDSGDGEKTSINQLREQVRREMPR